MKRSTAVLLLLLLSAPVPLAAQPAAEGTAAAAAAAAAAADRLIGRARQAPPRPMQGNDSFATYVARQASLEIQIGLRLYEAFDDYRAITALRRYAILANDPAASYLVHLMIGQIYHRNDRPTLAALEFERSLVHAPGDAARTWSYFMGLQELCLPLSYYLSCRTRLIELLQGAPLTEAQEDLARYQLLYTDVVLRSPHVDASRARALRDPGLRQKALGLVEQHQAFEQLPTKSPVAAGVLSAVLPGAGQLYNGRPYDALLALSFNAAFGVATWYAFAEAESIPLGVISALFSTGFYVGNIVNAVTDANRINAQLYLEFFERLGHEHWPRVAFGIQDNQVLFRYEFDWPGPRPSDPVSPEELREEEAEDRPRRDQIL